MKERHVAQHEADRAAHYRREDPVFARWAQGYGVIQHSDETQVHVYELAQSWSDRGMAGDTVAFYDLLIGLDLLASTGLWLVVHQTYARNVYLDGRALDTEDFKVRPEGHTGGSLNMVPAYAGYLAANVVTGCTRAWLMGQGHCVAAVDSVNLLVGNMTDAHAARYNVTDEGLTRYVRDFYSYRLNEDGRQDSPLGSHVNVHTAGGLAEGAIWDSLNCSTSICRCQANGSWRFCPTAPLKSSEAATGRRAGGARRIPAWLRRS